MLRLLRCRFWKSEPSRGPPIPSPPFSSGGISILMTLAPQSESCRTQVGPARTRVRSSTVKRASAWDACGIAMWDDLAQVDWSRSDLLRYPRPCPWLRARLRAGFRLPYSQFLGHPGRIAMSRLCAALAVIAALLPSIPAQADEWPSRPVRMVNTFAAGGTADVLT